MKFSWLQRTGIMLSNSLELYESIQICLSVVAGKLLLIYVAITILKFISLDLIIVSTKLHCHQSEPI